MFIVTINGIDKSAHTLEVDAQVQKARFEERGYVNIQIVEKELFAPPQE